LAFAAMAELGAAKGAGRQSKQTEKVPQETDVKVAGFRRRQKRYIENLDFDAAQQLDQEIKDSRFESHDKQIAQISEDLTKDATKIVELCRTAIQEWNDKNKRSQMKLRRRINRQFAAIQSQQIDALVQMEKDFAAARLRENGRTIPEQEELLQRARHAAMARQFDEARSLRDAAALIGETELDRRLMVLDEGFEQKRRQFLKVQRSEIEALSGQLDSEIGTIDEVTRQRIVEEGEKRARQLIALMDQCGSKLGSLGAPGEMDDRVAALEKEFTELLIALNCPVPRGIGCSARTRPTGKDQPPRRKVPRRTG
jgi:hypothetical protein